jgi:hypothetical protein
MTRRHITGHIRDTTPFRPDEVTGPSIAIFDALADGQWHDRDDLLATVAATVPDATGIRWGTRKGDPTPTGLDYITAIARGQRKFANNRVLIQIRGQRVIQDPTNPDRFRLAPGIAATWAAHKTAHPTTQVTAPATAQVTPGATP